MGKEPTHSDLLKELVELKKRVEKLEPRRVYPDWIGWPPYTTGGTSTDNTDYSNITIY